jgi:hypothetical protein
LRSDGNLSIAAIDDGRVTSRKQARSDEAERHRAANPSVLIHANAPPNINSYLVLQRAADPLGALAGVNDALDKKSQRVT